jgi:hypothetical protein
MTESVRTAATRRLNLVKSHQAAAESRSPSRKRTMMEVLVARVEREADPVKALTHIASDPTWPDHLRWLASQLLYGREVSP